MLKDISVLKSDPTFENIPEGYCNRLFDDGICFTKKHRERPFQKDDREEAGKFKLKQALSMGWNLSQSQQTGLVGLHWLTGWK